MRLGLRSVVGKLYALIGNDNAHTYTFQGVATAAGLISEDLVQLNDDTAGITLQTEKTVRSRRTGSLCDTTTVVISVCEHHNDLSS